MFMVFNDKNDHEIKHRFLVKNPKKITHILNVYINALPLYSVILNFIIENKLCKIQI